MVACSSKVSNLYHIGAQPPRSVTSFCLVIVWKAPTRVYGVITGYEVSSLPGGDNEVVVSKNRDEFFHAVKASSLPRGEGDILIKVSISKFSLFRGLKLSVQP